MKFPSAASCACLLRQLGQYQGAGALTGFGLLLRHFVQRKRLPFTAVFGRTLFPVLVMFLATWNYTRHFLETSRKAKRANPFSLRFDLVMLLSGPRDKANKAN